MKSTLEDKPIQDSLPYSIAKKIMDTIPILRKEGKTQKEIQSYVRNFINSTNWYKKLKPLEHESINQTNLKQLVENGLKNEQSTPMKMKMKIEFDRILELIKIALLVIIVILLSLNYYGGGSQSKYELYKNGRIRLNKVTGESYIRDHDGKEFVKMKIKE